MSDSNDRSVVFSLVLETEGRVWAVRPELMCVLAELHGYMVDGEAAAELMEAAVKRAQTVTKGNVAVVPLKGMITPQGSLFSMLFGGGGGGLAGFRDQLQAAVDNPDVGSIVLDVDSPGGLVDQVPETADAIKAARAKKPIVAVANTMAASAAYWLASQAHELAVTPSGEAGSIGVYQLHRDLSKAHEMAGIKPTLLSAGKYKVEGNPYAPLDDEATAAWQQAVDDYYGMFVKGVADGRGVDPETVANGYGEGRVLTAQRAKSAGLVDRVATLDQTVARLASGRAKVKQVEAADGKSRDQLVLDGDPAPEGNGSRLLTRQEKDRLLDTLASAR